MLEIEPMAGLANKMRAISAAHWLAKELDQELKVTWTPYRGLNCLYTDLFTHGGEFHLRERPRDLFHESRLFSYYFKVKALGYSKSLQLITTDKLGQDQVESLRGRQRILIASPHQFYGADKPLFGFRPREEISERIEATTGKFRDNTIGVHIRRGDHAISASTSTTLKFVEMMKGYLERDPDTLFFLSTDSATEERRLREEFGERIIANEKELSRNSRQGIADALLDLFCLSRTGKIIGSFYSSFSEVAARLGGIPMEVAS